MSSEGFYVSHNGNQIGPYSVKVIFEMVKKSELTILDYLYDPSKSDWVLLMEHPDLTLLLKDHKPASPPKPKGHASAISHQSDDGKTDPMFDEAMLGVKSKTTHQAIEWYVLKGDNKFGPFSYREVLKMLQEKVAFEFDFAWHPGLSTWVRIADLDEFKPAHISQIQSADMPDISEVFFRRRHRRVKFGGTVLIHDNKSVWKGTGVEISAGGAGVIMENAMIVPGQILYLHFKPGDEVPPFNATCEVVSKQFVEGVKDRNTPIRYGLRFTHISPSAQSLLQEFTNRTEVA